MNFKLPFTYKEHSGELHWNVLGFSKLYVAGKEVKKEKREWRVGQDTFVLGLEKVFIPKLIVNDTVSISLIKLKTWEWIFVLLPGLIFFFFGLVPALISVTGIYINLALFLSVLPKPIKILMSLVVFILALAVLFLIAV